jgi:hypothetical protein
MLIRLFKIFGNIVALGLLFQLLTGCSAHIKPNSSFAWPEMADSKIPGKLAIFIAPGAAQKVIKSNPASKFSHHDLLIGEAAAKLTRSACLSVFQAVVVFKEKPDYSSLKTAGFRGIIQLDSITAEVTLPTQSQIGDSISYSDLSIRLGLNYSTEDFLIDHELPPSFGPDGQYGKKMSAEEMKKLDKPLKEITNRILNESGKILAQSIVNIYGARQ